MPSVQLKPETYEALQAIADKEGRSPDAVAQAFLDDRLNAALETDEAYQQRWDVLLDRVRSRVPSAVTTAEIEADVAAAVAETRDERLARRR